MIAIKPRKCMVKGKQASRAVRQRVSPSRGDLHRARHPLARFRVQVHSRSITKNIFVVWRNRQRLRPTRTLASLSVGAALARPWPRWAARFGSSNSRWSAGRGERSRQPSNRSPRTSERARDWSSVGAAMTSETGVRSAPILAPKRRTTGLADL